VGNKLTMLDVSRLTGLHKNTINNYRKRSLLKFELVGGGKGRQVWLIDQDSLYNCGVPQILHRLGPQDVQTRLDKQDAGELQGAEVLIGENMRLNRELQVAVEELAGLRMQIPALEMARDERERLAKEKERLLEENANIAKELAEANAHLSWSYRRKLKKAVGE
jgi:hypothetical protein